MYFRSGELKNDRDYYEDSNEFLEYKVGENLLNFLYLDLEKELNKIINRKINLFNFVLFKMADIIHPYILMFPDYFFEIEEQSKTGYESLDYKSDLDVDKYTHSIIKFYQETYKTAVDLTFNMEYEQLKDLTPSQRYNIFKKSNAHNEGIISIYNNIPPMSLLNIKILNELKDSEYRQEYWYEISSLEQLLALEFQQMMEANIKLKKCGLCEKLTVMDRVHNRVQYCTRPLEENPNQTCQSFMSQKKNLTSIKEHPIKKIYQKKRKSIYFACSQHKEDAATKLTPDFYTNVWIKEATRIYDEYLSKYEQNPSENLINEMLEKLNNIV